MDKPRRQTETETEAVEKERAAACYLHRLEGVGEQTLRTLKFRLGALWNFFAAEPGSWQPFVQEKLQAVLAASQHQEAAALTWYRHLKKRGIGVLLADDPAYPPLLREIVQPPFILYWKGDLALTRRPALGVVGCRDCTDYGRQQAFCLSAQAAYCGLVIVSGMARGIDAAAHWGALRVKDGATIAVLGNGFDHVFPRGNKRLMEQIAERGLLLTEFSPGTLPMPGNFPRRNRIISGLSRGILVVEARRKSGSLITAGYALEQGREVYAIPGPLTGESSEGANRLLQNGARLVVRVEDILADYAVQIRQDLDELRRSLPEYVPETAETPRKKGRPKAKGTTGPGEPPKTPPETLEMKPETEPEPQKTESRLGAEPETKPEAEPEPLEPETKAETKSKPRKTKAQKPKTKPEVQKPKMMPETPETAEDDPILTALRQGKRTANDLLAETGLPPGEVMTRLLMLEIEGRIVSRPGNCYELSPEK